MSLRRFLLAVAFFSALTVFLTWPQAAHFGSAIFDHDDTYFSVWRLAWVAHALKVDPHHLYDANIFYPEPRALAYSDAMLFEGATTAPLIWAGLSATAAYNLQLFAAIVLSGVGMLALVRHLTRNDDAALLAAAVYVLLPYRVEHVMHLELQWTAWIPLSFWALHRAFESRSARFGIATALFAILQLLSCIYYGVFLVFALALVAVGLLVAERDLPRRALIGLVGGGIVTTPIAILYTLPYARNAEYVGVRPIWEVARYSAVPLSYLSSPTGSAIWGWTAKWFSGNELHLFPGVVALALGLVGVFSARRRVFWIYAALCVFAVEMSFGMNGVAYRWMRAHMELLGGFRAAARFSIFAFTALAVLAGLGYEWLSSRFGNRPGGVPLLPVLLVLVAAESGSGMPPLVSTEPPATPSLYLMITRLPPRPIAEFPMPQPVAPPLYDPVYMMWSTRHWRPLINGYSGYMSPQYLSTLDQVATFPDDRSIHRLAELGTGYVILHEALYARKDRDRLLVAIGHQPALAQIGQFNDWQGLARIFELRTPARR